MGITQKHFIAGIYLTYVILLHSCVHSDNIAVRKPTEQHGTWGGYGSARAVDGNVNQNFDEGSCAHPDGVDNNLRSGRGAHTWWRVELADPSTSKSMVVKNVTIYFRKCCADRIQGSYISVGNSSNVEQQTVCANVTKADYIQSFSCAPSTPVKYLSVVHPTNAHMGLCEVIVDGYEYKSCPQGKWGENCVDDCPCFTEKCNSITGVCESCDIGYFGRGCANRCHCFDSTEKCHDGDGTCRNGCDHQYFGTSCSEKIPAFSQGITFVDSTFTSITVEFSPSDPPGNYYLVEYAKDESDARYSHGESVDTRPNEDKYVVTQRNLDADTAYRIRVVPYLSSNRRGRESNPLFQRTKALPRFSSAPRAAPEGVTPTSVTIEFRPSNPRAESYRIEYRKEGDTQFTPGKTVVSSQSDPQMIKQDGLESDTEYTFRVVPIIDNRDGTPSGTFTTTTNGLPKFSSAPRVASGGVSSTSITIEFSVSDPRAESYQIVYRKKGDTQFTPGKKVDSSQSDPQLIKQDGLDPATEYIFQIIPIIDSLNVKGNPSQYITISTIAPAESVPPGTTTQRSTAATQSPDESTEVAPSSHGGTIAGVVVAFLLLLIILVIVVVVVRRRQGQKFPYFQTIGKLMHGKDKTQPGQKGSDEETGGSTRITPEITVIPRTPPPSRPPSPSLPRPDVVVLPPAIKVEDLGKYIETKKSQTDAFKEEFKKLPVGPTANWEVGNKHENKNKNRFLNIRAYDHSRVVLDTLRDDIHSDYINADYLTGYKDKTNVYVAAQGPKKTTIDDTWRMIWKTNTNRIVMVTNLVEGGKIKCDQYWPDKGEATYGDIKVTLVSTDHYAAYLIRLFNVELEDEVRVVRQFHFTSWPDHGVPTVGSELLEFRRRIHNFDREATGPLVIHCSAGVGRTGTYIAVDYCIEQAKEENEINMFAITYQMRNERVNMIQTLDQYIFAYDAIHEAILSGDKFIQAASFREEYKRLCKEDPETNKPLLAKEFELLEILKTPPGDLKPLVALEPDNIDKNRFTDIVPSNRYRPFLSSIVEGTTSYINAVYVDGFLGKLSYLATQMPLPHTVVDFWRLLSDHHSSTIIMLNQLDKNDPESGIYWPSDTEETLNFGPLEVSMTSVDTDHPHITVRDFKITSTKLRRSPVVRQFQLTSWGKEDEFPESRVSLLQLIDMVEKWQKQTENGPITIHCLDGATRCGLFIATVYATEQLKVEQGVDVFGAVKQVRIPRPQFISDIGHYKFVHEMLLEYMSGFGDYSNFV